MINVCLKEVCFLQEWTLPVSMLKSWLIQTCATHTQSMASWACMLRIPFHHRQLFTQQETTNQCTHTQSTRTSTRLERCTQCRCTRIPTVQFAAVFIYCLAVRVSDDVHFSDGRDLLCTVCYCLFAKTLRKEWTPSSDGCRIYRRFLFFF